MAQLARHHLAARRAAAVCAALALALPGATDAASSRRRQPGKVSGGQFTPGRPAVGAYGPDASLECVKGGVLEQILERLADAAKDAGKPAPQADGRVCAVAEAFLGWDPAREGQPRPRVLAFVSQWFGLPETVGPPIIDVLETEDERMIAERLAERGLAGPVLRAARPTIGVASLRVRKGETKIVVVVLDSAVELAPVPRRLDLNQTAKLTGKLVGGATDAEVHVSDAVGKLTETKGTGDAFAAEVACGDRPGRIQVEIRAQVEGRTAPVASFPIACGQDLPGAVALAAEPWPTDAAAAEKKIFELVNAERVAAGLQPLKLDPALSGIAREISADLAARGGGSGGPSLGERLKKEGIASQLVLQSAGADRTYERAHERLLGSPSNRANIMHPEATHAGIGAVTQNDAEGRPLVIVTEVFIKELPPVDVAAVRQQLRDAVAQKRKDARTNALAPDPTLDEVAQTYAEALAAAGGGLDKERSAELTAPLNKPFRTVVMVSGAKPDPLDFAEEPQTTAPAKVLGVGVAQGKHAVLGRNAVYVVLMVGTPRGAAAEDAAPAKKKPAPKKPAAAAPKK